MSRHLGVGTWLAETLAVAEPVFALLTQVGSTWLLGGLALLLYVLGDAVPGWDRRRGGAVVAAVLLAVALTGALKAALAMPRPAGAGTPAYAVPGLVGDLYAWAATADGYGVPSGHALGSTAVYGTVAALVARRHRRRAALLAAGLVAVAVLTRLALGVHLLVDVVAGVGVGLAVVWVATRWPARPALTFGLAVTTAAAWAVLEGVGAESVGATAVSLGAALAWHRYGDRIADAPGRPTPGLVAGTLGLAGVAFAATQLGGTAIAAAVGVAGMGGAVALPIVAE